MAKHLCCAVVHSNVPCHSVFDRCWRCFSMVLHQVQQKRLFLNLLQQHALVFYVHRDKSSLQFPIVTSTKNAWFYHLGSAACGSFFITLFNVLVYFLRKIERRLRKSGNCCGLLSCIKCFCWLGLYMFRKILQFITTNAYIEIGSRFQYLLSCCPGDSYFV